MAQANPPEPSMEEILASIRKIIAEDVPSHAAAEISPADVIELTEILQETPAEAATATAPGRLVSEGAAERSARAMEALRAAIRREAGHQTVPLDEGANRTVEDVVRELVKPMLREWLDANLPRLVERLVEKEIRDIARRSGES